MDELPQNNARPIFYRDALELAELIRTKQISPVEVVHAHLERIAATNGKVNAIATLLADEAIDAAKAAEQAVVDGQDLSLFHGVPFTIKDAIDLKDVVTQAGSKLLATNIAARDATVVARMKNTGALPIAKTNVPEFSYWTETDNRVVGRTNNPWSLERTPGGSSGGESAAIASGMSPMGLGSDVAISIRGPAALTGIVGLKATHGRVPFTGHCPSFLSRYWHIGPMARSVRDVEAMFNIIQGADGTDPYAIHATDARPAMRGNIDRPLKIGVSTDDFGPIHSEVKNAIQDAAVLLRDLGYEIEPVSIPTLRQNDFVTVGITLTSAEMLPEFRRFVAGRENDLSAVGARLANAPDPALRDFIAAQQLVQELKSAFARYFMTFDVLLCPVTPFPAPLHAHSQYSINGGIVAAAQIKRATVPFNLTGLPAISIPFAISQEGLPLGIQMVSRWLDEEVLFRLGKAVESATSFWVKHAPLL